MTAAPGPPATSCYISSLLPADTSCAHQHSIQPRGGYLLPVMLFILILSVQRLSNGCFRHAPPLASSIPSVHLPTAVLLALSFSVLARASAKGPHELSVDSSRFSLTSMACHNSGGHPADTIGCAFSATVLQRPSFSVTNSPRQLLDGARPSL